MLASIIHIAILCFIIFAEFRIYHRIMYTYIPNGNKRDALIGWIVIFLTFPLFTSLTFISWASFLR